jgi:hypothetical protein
LNSKRAILAVTNTAKAVITARTLTGQSLSGGPFAAYSTKPYYASVGARAPGVPAPSGGRDTALRGGRKLKSRVYDAGYGQYKAALGRGATPQLSLTNMMLDAMLTQAASPQRGIIFFGSQAANQKAHGLHSGKFPFFGMLPSERSALYQSLAAYLRTLKGVT